jgi:hypothetical protein
MKYLKMLGLAAVAAMALMAFGAGSASANTTICETTVAPCPAGWAVEGGDTLDATLTGTAILETTTGAVLDTCNAGTVKGTVSGTGVATTPTGTVAAAGLTWGPTCTRTTDTLEGGSIQIHANADHTGAGKARGFNVTVSTVAFGSCTFGLPAGEYSSMGTATSGTPGVIHINTLISKIAGACPNQVRATATFNLTSPSTATVIP